MKCTLKPSRLMLDGILVLAGVLFVRFASGAPEAPSFLSDYIYGGNDLGAVYTPGATTLKLWAPTARNVTACLFDNPSTVTSVRLLMTRDKDGIWSATVTGDADGKYYLYEVELPERGWTPVSTFLVNDPYARGSSANSKRTLIYNPAKTNPVGWEKDHFVSLQQNVDAVIYEVHIRDFTLNANSGVSPAWRGKYLGMVEAGTRTPQGERSGLSHLEELGVTHVHLLPVQDFFGGDERQKADEYSWYDWGYGPMLFNTPEGSYATDPDGIARQKEFKEMVQALHQHGIGVLMDVVYNHTFATGSGPASVFDKVYPGYYYRQDASGKYANGTYCGNELASERPMVRKFIVESIKYWVTEYHVDGFRFDLMGIEDRETMTQIYREARKLNPNALVYGEGWDMEKVLPREQMMTQANVRGTGIAAFNDGIRDNIKGDAGNGPGPGFVQGAGPPYGGMTRFLLNLKGQSTGKDKASIEVFSPNETVNYASAHDDHCLWDKLQLSAPNVPGQTRMNMDKLAAGLVLTAQGVPFLHAGDEFLRSKKLVKNSYNNNDPAVNPLDWSLKAKHKDAFEFYRGLIALRKAHPAFRMTDRNAVNRSMEFVPATPENVVAYVLKGNANGDTWRNIVVVYNGTKEAQTLKVRGDWSVVVDNERAGTELLRTVRDELPVSPFSMMVAHTEGEY